MIQRSFFPHRVYVLQKQAPLCFSSSSWICVHQDLRVCVACAQVFARLHSVKVGTSTGDDEEVPYPRSGGCFQPGGLPGIASSAKPGALQILVQGKQTTPGVLAHWQHELNGHPLARLQVRATLPLSSQYDSNDMLFSLFLYSGTSFEHHVLDGSCATVACILPRRQATCEVGDISCCARCSLGMSTLFVSSLVSTLTCLIDCLALMLTAQSVRGVNSLGWSF